MKTRNRLLIFDPIAFSGGSKAAIRSIMSSANLEADVLTLHPESWNEKRYATHKLFIPKWLINQDRGWLFLLRHLVYALNILTLLVRRPRINHLMGTSGPGIDLAVYLLSWLTPWKNRHRILQFIQGPVASSKLSARCLLTCDNAFYLPQTKQSIEACLRHAGHENPEVILQKFEPMINGLTQEEWPTTSNISETDCRLFWAASNLKWKGLDLMTQVLQRFETDNQALPAYICFIKAPDNLEQSRVNVPIAMTEWFERPDNLDELRSRSNLFVSTSQFEPFGLSILEALAAGLCVLIPRDDAYWDRHLSHGIHCIKYTPNNVDDLQKQITYLRKHPVQRARIAREGRKIAENYRAEHTYSNVIAVVNSLNGEHHEQAYNSVS